MRFEWTKLSGGYRCCLPHGVTLVVTPHSYARGGLAMKPARGTGWHAQASVWCDRTSTLSRFGRDEYANQQSSAKEAMKLAESIYRDALDALDEGQAIEIVTWQDEPELLREPGQPDPVFSAAEVAAARTLCDRMEVPEV